MINLIYSGIIYFYRFHLNATSSHLFIHRVSAKLSNRVMPYGEITFSFSADVKGQVYDRLVTINYGRITDSFTVSK